MAPRLDLISTLLGGTEALRAKGETYLPRYNAESTKNWDDRLKHATLTNYFERTVDSLTGKPFSKPIVIHDDMAPELVDLCENIDHQGNNLDVFGRNAFRLGVAKGLIHILVEYPNVAAANPTSKADEEAINAKPYFVMIEPENIISAHYENRNGSEFLTQVRIMETETRMDGFDEVIIERIRVLYPGAWELWQKDERKKWTVVDSGVNTLDYIPLVTFYAHREDFMTSKPPLIDLAYVNIAYYQGSADQNNILAVARFPMLAVSGANEEEAAVRVGPRQVLSTVDPQGKFYYVEHTGAAIQAGLEDLQHKQEEMEALGVELLAKSGNITATAKAIDSAKDISMLQALVLIFTDALEQAFQVASDWLELKVPVGGLTINSDFGLSLDDTVSVPALQAARTSGDLSRPQFLKELKRRNILEADFDVDEDAALLVEEQKKKQDDMAFEFGLQKSGLLPDPNAPKVPVVVPPVAN